MKGKYYNIEEAYKLIDKRFTFIIQPRRQRKYYKDDENDLIDSILNLYGEPTIYETSQEPTTPKAR